MLQMKCSLFIFFFKAIFFQEKLVVDINTVLFCIKYLTSFNAPVPEPFG